MSTPDTPRADPPLPASVVWTLRGLAIAGLAVACFLAFVHVAGWWAEARAVVPLCGGVMGFDCDSVLNSRWALWLGVPVALPAAGLYAVVVGLLWSLHRPWAWAWLTAAVTVIAGAGLWFLYVQGVVLGRWCMWCTAEHLIGLTLAGLVWCFAIGRLRPAGAWTGAAAGALAVAVLVGGQVVYRPAMIEVLPGGTVDAEDRWIAEGAEDGGVALLDGRVVLNPRAHPVHGLPQADRFIVEMIDYTCPHCAILHRMMKHVRQLLGPRYAVVVVTVPLSRECNPGLMSTLDQHRNTCELTRLAWAVWLADAERFEDYQDWLFENQAALIDGVVDVEAARDAAAALVGGRRLGAALADGRIDELIARDVHIATRLGVSRLPGLVVGTARFRQIPDTTGELAALIEQAYREGAER